MKRARDERRFCRQSRSRHRRGARHRPSHCRATARGRRARAAGRLQCGPALRRQPHRLRAAQWRRTPSRWWRTWPTRRASRRSPTRSKRVRNQIDILVNNAGIELDLPFEQVTPELFDRLIAVNLRAPLLLTQALVSLFPGDRRRHRQHQFHPCGSCLSQRYSHMRVRKPDWWPLRAISRSNSPLARFA